MPSKYLIIKHSKFKRMAISLTSDFIVDKPH